MSHAVLLVITKSGHPAMINQLMAPYDEDPSDKRYLEKHIEIPAKERKANMLKALHVVEESDSDKKEENIAWIRKCIQDEEYEEFVEEWHGYHQDEEGNWYYTTNPNARWDWWVVGGRWPGMLKSKTGKSLDKIQIKDAEESCLKQLSTYAVLDNDGNWYERSKMGWWAISYIDKDSECMCAPESIPAEDVEAMEKNKWYGPKYKETILTHINHLYVRKDDCYELPEGVEVPSEVMEIDFFRVIAWKQAFYERFLKDLDPNMYLTIVDYHI